MSRCINALLFLAAALFGAAAPAAAQSPAPDSDVVAANVEGQPIYRSEVLRAFETLPEQMKQAGIATIYPTLLERMIQQKLLVIDGRQAKMAADPEVKKRLRRLEDAVIGDVYLNRLIEKKLTPEILRDRYNQFLKQNPPGEQVRARHILVNTEAEAKKVLDQIAAGKSFEEMAREFSTGPSASKGGDLGYFKRDEMVKAFSDAAFALKAGEVTKTPVKTRFGWHVIKVEDRRMIKPPSFEDMKPRLLQQAGRRVAIGLMTEMVEKAKVERFALDGKPLPKPQ